MARLIVVLAGGVVLGLTITGDVEQPQWLNVAVAIILLALVVAAYEVSVASLTWVLGRISPGPTKAAEASDSDRAPPPVSPARWTELRAPQALALLGAYLAGQTLVWVIVGIVAVVRAGTGADTQAIEREILRLAPAAVLVSIIAGAGFALLLYRRKAERTADEDLGWGRAEPRDLALGLACGLGVAIIYLLGAPLLAESPQLSEMGLLSKLVAAGGIARVAWAFAGVILAPPVEELVFRGALFSGLARSWGHVAAIVVTTVVFALLHLPDVGVYWPAAAAVTLLGLALAIIRVRTGRIAPCIVAHCSYNLVMVLTAYGVGVPVGPA